MLSVVVQNDFVKYNIDNYHVEGNKNCRLSYIGWTVI